MISSEYNIISWYHVSRIIHISSCYDYIALRSIFNFKLKNNYISLSLFITCIFFNINFKQRMSDNLHPSWVMQLFVLTKDNMKKYSSQSTVNLYDEFKRIVSRNMFQNKFHLKGVSAIIVLAPTFIQHPVIQVVV